MILWTMCQKTDEGGGRKHYFVSCSCSFKLCLSQVFHFRKFQVFFAIIFNSWRKTVIRLVFLFDSTISTVKYCTKTLHFQILISFCICCYLLQSIFSPAFWSSAVFDCPPQWRKKDSRNKSVICDAVSERRIRTTRTVSWLVSKLCVAN